jgi:hypothetical protein
MASATVVGAALGKRTFMKRVSTGELPLLLRN